MPKKTSWKPLTPLAAIISHHAQAVWGYVRETNTLDSERAIRTISEGIQAAVSEVNTQLVETLAKLDKAEADKRELRKYNKALIARVEELEPKLAAETAPP